MPSRIVNYDPEITPPSQVRLINDLVQPFAAGLLRPIQNDIAARAAVALPTMLQSRKTGAFVHLSRELLSRGYSVRFRASGGSMRPAICDGDLITIEPARGDTLTPGSVVAYHREGRLFVHRIVRVEAPDCVRSMCVLRGDAATDFDAPVPADQILGIVVAVRPTVASAARRATAWLLAAIAGALAPIRQLSARLAE